MGLWTSWHAIAILPAFAVFVVVAIFFGKWLRKQSEKVRFLPFQIIAVVLLVLEVAKQICSASGGEYDMYSLPFHYCSLFLYLLPVHAFYKGKGAQTLRAVTFACCASLFLFMLVMPTVVYSDEKIQTFGTSFMSFHTVVFHHLVCFYFLLMLTAKTYDVQPKRDLKAMSLFFGGYVTVAAILAYTLKVNFHNLYRCNLAPVEEIRVAMVENMGWAGSLIWVLIIFVLTILFAFLAYYATVGIVSLIEKLTKKRTNHS